jgi:3-oxoadipate enol-lactonase
VAIVSNGAVALHYEVGGDVARPWLVLSGSLGTNLHMWNPQAAALEKDFRVLRYDMRGHGRSPVPPGPYTVSEMADDVIRMMDELGIEQAHFCGLSIGGAIGQSLAIHHADRVNRLVLCNTASKIGTADGWNARIAKVETEGMASISEAVIGRWFASKFMRSNETTVTWMREMLEKNNPAGYAATCAAVRDMDLRQDVRKIETPTCVISGDFDLVTPVLDAVSLVSSIAGARLKRIPASHIANVEAPAIFTETVLEFLKTGDERDG